MPTAFIVSSLAAVVVMIIAQTVVLVVSYRERSRFYRRPTPGVSSHCTNCDYPLGHWSEPRCPECGTDARTAGVRLRARPSRRVKPAMITYIVLQNVLIVFFIMLVTATLSPVWRWFGAALGIIAFNVYGIRSARQQLHATVIVEPREEEWSNPAMACPDDPA